MNVHLPANRNTEFPQNRNGVRHSLHGLGVVTHGRGYIDEESVTVRFDGQEKDTTVHISELSSAPERSESPDPAYSRSSRWTGGSSYRNGR